MADVNLSVFGSTVSNEKLICTTDMSKIYLVDYKNGLAVVKVVNTIDFSHLYKEIQILNLINNSSNLFLNMYESKQMKNETYILTEFINGLDLYEYISQDYLDIKTLWYVYGQMVLSVLKAHQLGIIHRDIKPENFMIDINGNIKLIDWGMAILTDDIESCEENNIIGTPEYLDIELLQSRKTKVSFANDVWSLGIILYVITARRFPIDLDNKASLNNNLNRLIRKQPLDLKLGFIDDELVKTILRKIFVCAENRVTTQELYELIPSQSSTEVESTKEQLGFTILKLKNEY